MKTSNQPIKNTLIQGTLKAFSAILIGIVGLALAMGTASAKEPQFQLKPFDAVYTLKKGGISLGNAYFSLKDLGDGYWEYASYIEPSGFAKLISNDRVRESSLIEVVGNTIRPAAYSYEQTGSETERTSITFNWFKRVASITHNGTNFNRTLTGDEHDHYSLVLTLMEMASSNTPSKKMTVINKDTKQYTYTNKGWEKVKTTLKRFNAIKLVQSSDSSRSLHYWLSPQVNFVPVKIEQHKKGKKKFELTIKSFKFK